MTGQAHSKTDAGADGGRAIGAAVAVFWLLNVPLGIWLGRGYHQAADLADVGLLGRLMSAWLLGLAVAVVLAPGLVGALAALRLRWGRLAAGWALAWCAVAQAALLVDSTLYRLMRLHLADAQARAVLREPEALETIGITAGTLRWGLVAIAALAVVEAAALAGLWLVARRTDGFGRLRQRVGRLPWVVRWGAVAIVLGPPLAAVAVDPRGPLLAVPRHFLIPLAPAEQRRSPLLDRVNAALQPVAAGRRQPPGGAPVPAIAVPGSLQPRTRPSIVFLCIESLRSDVVTPEVMPHLAALGREAVVARRHYAEGNTTFHCVFAALSGQHPLWYGRARKDHARPAPLEALRAAGYRLHALASAELEWVGMDETVLQRPMFATYDQILGDPVAGDREVCRRLLRIAREADGPFLAFAILNATHFHYVFPPEAERFRPAPMPDLNPIVPGRLARQRDALWNRYRNAAGYVDGLVGELVAALRRDALLDRMVLIVAADHGENFLEEGLLGHGCSFHDVQVRIPCLVRYPGGPAREVTGLTQDADLFPSVLAEMGLADAAAALPGFRTLRPEADETRPWAVSAMAAPHTPVDYQLLTDRLRCRFWLNTKPDGEILLEATALTTPTGASLPATADTATDVAATLAAWLDRQGFTGHPRR